MIVIMIYDSCNKAVQIGGYIDNIHKSNTESFQTYIFIVRFNHNVRIQTKPCPFSSPHGSYTIHTAISVLRLSKQPWTINIIDNDKTKHISINNGNKYMKKTHINRRENPITIIDMTSKFGPILKHRICKIYVYVDHIW